MVLFTNSYMYSHAVDESLQARDLDIVLPVKDFGYITINLV